MHRKAKKIKIHPNKLRAIRIAELDMTQGEFAEEQNMAKSTYNRYEQEPGKIPLEKAVEIFNYISRKLEKIEKEKAEKDPLEDEPEVKIKFGDIFFS